MAKEFNSLKEIEKYYDEKSNTYIFKENDEYIDTVVFDFDLDVKANIDAKDIKAWDIKAWYIIACNIDVYNINANNINVYNIDAIDINAHNIYALDIIAWDINVNDIYAVDIKANNIKANNISYYAVCFAYSSIKCKSIKGRRKNAKHFVLDGKLEVIENDKKRIR